MAIITANISVPSIGMNQIITPLYSSEFQLSLNSKLTYDIGLDQSSSCTGIFIKSVDSRIRIIIDVKRDTGDPYTFYRELKGFLKKLVKGQKIRHVICEDPPPVQNQRYTTKFLNELLGRVSEWMEDIPEFQNAEFNKILPQSWKALVMDKSKGKNRSKNKECIAEDICDIYPEFNSYRDYHFSKDYDGFDACGILTGFLRYSYTDNGTGIRMIAGTKKSRGKAYYAYRYIPVELANKPECINDFLGETKLLFGNIPFYAFNYSKSVIDNIKIAGSNFKSCFTIAPEKELSQLRFMYDIEEKDDYILLLYILSGSAWTNSELRVFQALLPMNGVIDYGD